MTHLMSNSTRCLYPFLHVTVSTTMGLLYVMKVDWRMSVGLVEHGVGHVLNLIDAPGDHTQAFALHLLVVGSNKLNPRGSSLEVTVKNIIEFDS